MKHKSTIALIGRIREKANRFIMRELEKQGIKGFVPSHGDILASLFVEGKATMQELAAKIHRTKPTVTVLVDKLVALGFVAKEKTAKDSRVTHITLTKKGEELRPAFDAISRKLNETAWKGLSDEDIERLEKVLNTIGKNFDEAGR